MEKVFEEKKECRLCKGENLVKTIDLGLMPLANSHKKVEDEHQEKIPLIVNFCKDCANSQLSVVVNPKIMFSEYVYFSSVSKTFQNHCTEMAKKVKSIMTKDNLIIVDIASNDGCLLEQFKKEGFETIGVEPAQNIAKIANEKKIKTYCEFWNKEVAQTIKKEQGVVDVITATNVFAHVDDVHDFVKNIKNLLAEDGMGIIEFPYMGSLVKHKEFDTIYHEHLSYFLIKPLMNLFSKHSLVLADIDTFEIHGGTLRLYITKDNGLREIQKEKIANYLLKEEKEKLYHEETYQSLNEEIKKIKDDFLDFLKEQNGKKIMAYGASAKGNVFLNFCKINKSSIIGIIDDTPAKQGKFFSGTNIPIVPFEEIERQKPDYLVILAWNFAKEIMKKTSVFKSHGGSYVIAIPHLQIK